MVHPRQRQQPLTWIEHYDSYDVPGRMGLGNLYIPENNPEHRRAVSQQKLEEAAHYSQQWGAAWVQPRSAPDMDMSLPCNLIMLPAPKKAGLSEVEEIKREITSQQKLDWLDDRIRLAEERRKDCDAQYAWVSELRNDAEYLFNLSSKNNSVMMLKGASSDRRMLPERCIVPQNEVYDMNALREVLSEYQRRCGDLEGRVRMLEAENASIRNQNMSASNDFKTSREDGSFQNLATEQLEEARSQVLALQATVQACLGRERQLKETNDQLKNQVAELRNNLYAGRANTLLEQAHHAAPLDQMVRWMEEANEEPENMGRSLLTESVSLLIGTSTASVTAAEGIDIRRVLKTHRFRRWVDAIANEKRIVVSKVHIQCADADGSQVSLIKFKVEAVVGDQPIPGIVVLRGATVAIFIILKHEGKTSTVLMRQARVPVCLSSALEIPVGMLNESGDFIGAVADRLKDIGIQIRRKDLTNMTELAYNGKYEGAFPSSGECDENLQVFLYQQVITSRELTSSRKRLAASANKHLVTLEIIDLTELWWKSPDSKSLVALCLYDKLKSARRIREQIVQHQNLKDLSLPEKLSYIEQLQHQLQSAQDNLAENRRRAKEIYNELHEPCSNGGQKSPLRLPLEIRSPSGLVRSPTHVAFQSPKTTSHRMLPSPAPSSHRNGKRTRGFSRAKTFAY